MSRKNPFFRVLKVLFICILIPVLALAGWTAYAAYDRVSPLTVLKNEYTALVHTDNIYESVSPVLDVKAADALLADPALVGYRPVFLALRSSPYRENAYVKAVASCRADVALYAGTDGSGSMDFVAAVDMGIFSAVTRLVPYAGKFLKVPGLAYIPGSAGIGSSYVAFHAKDEKKGTETVVYTRPYHNLLVISLNSQLLQDVFSHDYSQAYPAEEKALLESSCDEPFRVVAKARRFASLAAHGNNAVMQVVNVLSDKSDSVITFSIADDRVLVNVRLPFDEEQERQSPLAPLLEKKSTLPALILQLGESVQYYTLLNAGTLSELKSAVFPLVQQTQDIESAWNEGETWCRKLFSASIEEMLFSWSGTEFAVFGMEGSSDPVFAVQVSDELKRQEIFKRLTSSILIRHNTNLVVDGVRIPRLELPSFFRGLLKLFKVELPRPYYLVQGGYIYFSESPHTLSALCTEYKSQKLLSGGERWRKVSSGQEQEASVSLYYNLERSMPFFLQGEGLVTRLLRLYNIGRGDICLDGTSLVCTLHAATTDVRNSRLIPGFPFALDGTTDFELQAECADDQGNVTAVFFVEGGTTVKSLELDSLQQHRLLFSDGCTVTAAAERCAGDGVLWAVTSKGVVYLLDRSLACVQGFPVITGCVPAARAGACGKSVLIPTGRGTVITVYDDGKCIEAVPGADSVFKSAPCVAGEYAAVYAKGFDGGIYLLRDGNFINPASPVPAGGIGFGSPCLMELGGSQYIAFITQAGKLSVFKDGAALPGFPIKLPGIFRLNAVYAQGCFYVLSEDAKLYRVELDGSFSFVDVAEGVTARQGTLCVQDNTVFVSTDENVLYGFRTDLGLNSGYPLAGRGTPVLADVDGDGVKDCLLLSLDRKLYAWNMK